MLRDRLKTLFNNYDSAVRRIIQEVGELEQQHISKKNPRGIMNQIDEVITQIAREEIEQLKNKGEN